MDGRLSCLLLSHFLLPRPCPTRRQSASPSLLLSLSPGATSAHDCFSPPPLGASAATDEIERKKSHPLSLHIRHASFPSLVQNINDNSYIQEILKSPSFQDIQVVYLTRIERIRGTSRQCERHISILPPSSPS